MVHELPSDLRRVLASEPQEFTAWGDNWASLKRFRLQIGRFWRHVLKRHSQRGRFTLKHMVRLYHRWLIQAWIVHPYPSVHFAAVRSRY